MKVSELIYELNKTFADYGDYEVYIVSTKVKNETIIKKYKKVKKIIDNKIEV